MGSILIKFSIRRKLTTATLRALIFISLSAFSINVIASTLQIYNLTATTHCATCGMFIMKYPGPHAQVVWKKNNKIEHKFYGNLSEAMQQIVSNEKSVIAVYVQPLGKKAFEKMFEKDNWMNAKDAIYVINSPKKRFVMGNSYTPFKTTQEAKAFQKINGGEVVNYNQLVKIEKKNSSKSPISTLSSMRQMNMWMFNIMQMYMNMGGFEKGTEHVSPPTAMMIPESMDMFMTMFMGMYMTKDWSVMLMTSYNVYSMPMLMNMMKKSIPFTMRSAGIGDTRVIGGYNFLNDYKQMLTATVGISFPTGRINHRGPMPLMTGNILYEYMMQMGSGTFDPIFGLKYIYYKNAFALGVSFNTIQRLYKNYRDYELGSEYAFTTWLNYHITPRFAIIPKIQDIFTEKTNGVAAGTMTNWGPNYNPAFTGGNVLNFLLGAKICGSGRLRYDSLTIEAGLPIYQNLNGPQMKQRWQASASLNFMFM